jgi:tetratricopeptide (TPR) repeat protein
LQLAPDDPVLHFNLGNVYAALEDPDNAIKHFVIAIQIDPEYEEAWTNLETLRATKYSDGDRRADAPSRPHIIH